MAWYRRFLNSAPSPLQSYSSAVAMVAIAWLIRLAFDPFLGMYAPYLPFTLAVILAGRYGGRGPALAATGFSVLCSGYFLLESAYHDPAAGSKLAIILPLFATVGVCISLLTGQLHRALQVSQSSEAQLRRFATFAPVAMAMFDRNMRYLAVSERFLRDYHLEGQDLLGKSHYEVFPDIPERWREVHRRCLAGASERCEEDLFLRADGNRSWLRWEVTPWHQTNGRIGGVVMFTEDITSRKRHEAALQESEERFRTLFENAADGIFITSPNGRFTEVNTRGLELTGYSRDEFLSMGIADVISIQERGRVILEIVRVKNGQTSLAEWLVVRKDGSTFPGEVSAQLLPDGRLLGILRDLSERRRLERQFIQAQKLEGIGRLAGGVAHDFNNLLTIIGGYAQMGRDESECKPCCQEAFEEIGKASGRAAALTRQLLAFSRNDVIEPRNVDLDELVRNFEKMLHRIIGEDIDLTLSLNCAAGVFRADPGRIEQVILNLVVNARDAMPMGGRLLIETGRSLLDGAFPGDQPATPGAYVTLAVTDTGMGMSDDTKSHLFEPFFTTKEPGKGTGLGLSTVYGIVKQIGGSIWVHSEAGRGSTIRVLFPEVRAAVDAAREELPLTDISGTETILLAEDEPAVRRYVRHLLEKHGYTVIEAANGREALELARRYSPAIHLLITDIVMPEMGGVELIRRFAEEWADLPVLCMSGYADRLWRPENAFVRLIQKPFAAHVLLGSIRELMTVRVGTAV